MSSSTSRMLFPMLVCLSLSCFQKVGSESIAERDARMQWNLAALIDSGSSMLTVLGDPGRLSGEFGPSVVFDGVDDALFLDADPLRGLDRFTVEVVFRPASGGAAAQRFLHMGEMSRDRIMIETRLNDRGQ